MRAALGRTQRGTEGSVTPHALSSVRTKALKIRRGPVNLTALCKGLLSTLGVEFLHVGVTKNGLTQRDAVTILLFYTYICCCLLSRAGTEIHLAVSSAVGMEWRVNMFFNQRIK